MSMLVCPPQIPRRIESRNILLSGQGHYRPLALVTLAFMLPVNCVCLFVRSFVRSFLTKSDCLDFGKGEGQTLGNSKGRKGGTLIEQMCCSVYRALLEQQIYIKPTEASAVKSKASSVSSS